jgi:hypothetical protein
MQGTRTYGKRFFISWIISSVLMFGLSYLWHGVVLNDYSQISYPLGIYLTAAAVAYLFIGFLVGRAFVIPFFDRISRHPLLRGPAIGFACGMLVYVISMVVQVSINKDMNLKYFLLDFTWQGIEQAFGGFIVGLVYMTVFEPLPFPVEEEN